MGHPPPSPCAEDCAAEGEGLGMGVPEAWRQRMSHVRKHLTSVSHIPYAISNILDPTQMNQTIRLKASRIRMIYGG